jgi:YVTN family beta-propeller protein
MKALGRRALGVWAAQWGAAGIAGPAAAAGLRQGPPPAPVEEIPEDVVAGEGTGESATTETAGRRNVYAATMRGLAPQLVGVPERVYVPNEVGGTVSVVDAATLEVIGRFPAGRLPHHVTPDWDLSKLYVSSMSSGLLVEVDPVSGMAAGQRVLPAPYNLYFTPDGEKAIVVAETLNRLDWYERTTWRYLKSTPVPWAGVDHLDFSADGDYLIASTEFSGVAIRVDTTAMVITGQVRVGGLPIDVRLVPDGSVFYIANQSRHGVSLVEGNSLTEVGFVPTDRGAHGLAMSRNARYMYVGNRLAGSISVMDTERHEVVATWPVGGSPDMLQVSSDGQQLWISNRFGSNVTVVNTDSGGIVKQILVGSAPHGLAFFPQPGRISLGHNGVYR